MSVVRNLMIRAGADFSELEKELKSAQKTLKAAGKEMTSLGKDLTRGITAPVVALGAVTMNAAVDFEAAFAGVRKTVTGTEEQLQELSDGIRQMSKEIPTSAIEIAGLAESAGQLGIETEAIMGFTRVMADLGATTNIVGEDGAASLARFANITQMSQQDFDRLGSTVIAVGNSLATTEAEVVDMSMRLAAAGSQAGMTEAQTVGLAGALSSLGLEAQAGGTAFSKVIIEMQLAAETGSEKLNNFAEVAGMSAEEFARAYKEDAMTALLMFVDGLGKSEERGLSAIKVLDDMGIKEVRVRDALLRAAGASDILRDSVDLATVSWAENTALAEKAEERYKTNAAKLAIMKNELTDLAVTFGELLLPVVGFVADKIGALTEWLSGLDEGTKKNIITVLGLAATLGPLLMIAGGVATKIAGLIGMISKFSAAIAAGKGAAGALGAALGPGGVVMLALIAFLAIGYLLIKNWDKIKEGAAAALEGIKGAWETVSTWFSEKVLAPLESGFKATVNFVIGLAEGFANSWIRAINSIIGAFNRISFSIPDWVPIIGGKSFKFGLSTWPEIQLPRLGAGGVFEPNNEFLAILGDQKAGRNIEAPEDLLRQIVREEMTGGQASSEITVRFEGTMAQLVRSMKPSIEREDRRVGTSLVEGAASW